MSLKIAQFRYYGEKNSNQNNFPIETDIRKETYGKSLWPYYWTFEKYQNIQSIKIQTVPGIKLYINQNKHSSALPILLPYVVGSTGTLDIVIKNSIIRSTNTTTNLLTVTGIAIDEKGQETINNLDDGYLIITIIYK